MKQKIKKIRLSSISLLSGLLILLVCYPLPIAIYNVAFGDWAPAKLDAQSEFLNNIFYGYYYTVTALHVILLFFIITAPSELPNLRRKLMKTLVSLLMSAHWMIFSVYGLVFISITTPFWHLHK